TFGTRGGCPTLLGTGRRSSPRPPRASVAPYALRGACPSRCSEGAGGLSDVIQPYGWSSDTLLLFNAAAGEWRTYHTKNLEPPGKLRNARVRWFHPDGSKFKLIPSIRMLVEVHRRILDEEEDELKQRLGQFAEGYARRWWAKEVGGMGGLEGREVSPRALEL
ncbi:unnamed protein product, partial [Prorocentrum cordatum]